MPARMPSGASRACAHSGRRGAPSSTRPMTFTKQNSASAAVAASASGRERPGERDAERPVNATCSSDCSVSHSEANPFSGGSPAIAIAPIGNAPPVHGIRRSSPPRRSSSRLPTALAERPGAEEQQRLEDARG